MFPELPPRKRHDKKTFPEEVIALAAKSDNDITYSNESGNGEWALWIQCTHDPNGGFAWKQGDFYRIYEKQPFSKFTIHFSDTVEDAAATIERFGRAAQAANGVVSNVTIRGHGSQTAMAFGNPSDRRNLLSYLESVHFDPKKPPLEADVKATFRLRSALQVCLSPKGIFQLDGCDSGKLAFAGSEKACCGLVYSVSFDKQMKVPLLAWFAGALGASRVWGSQVKHCGFTWKTMKITGEQLGSQCLDVVEHTKGYWQMRLHRALVFAHVYPGADGRKLMSPELQTELKSWASGDDFKKFRTQAETACKLLALDTVNEIEELEKKAEDALAEAKKVLAETAA